MSNKLAMKHPMREALAVISSHKKEFAAINAAFFGLFLMTMTWTLLKPELQPPVTQAISGVLRLDLVAKIYGSGNMLLAAGTTLAVNTTVAVLLITLPSFIVPFFGVAFALLFAAVYGIVLAPIGPLAGAMIPHSITVLIEFEAYIIAAFGAFVFGRATFFPPLQDRRSLGERYLDGAKAVGLLYLLVAPLLVIGAVYEAFEIIHLVKYFI